MVPRGLWGENFNFFSGEPGVLRLFNDRMGGRAELDFAIGIDWSGGGDLATPPCI